MICERKGKQKRQPTDQTCGDTRHNGTTFIKCQVLSILHGIYAPSRTRIQCCANTRSGHRVTSLRCPLYPRKRTFAHSTWMILRSLMIRRRCRRTRSALERCRYRCRGSCLIAISVGGPLSSSFQLHDGFDFGRVLQKLHRFSQVLTFKPLPELLVCFLRRRHVAVDDHTFGDVFSKWWERQDSNLRRHSQRIYSPPPLPLGTLSPEAVAPY